MRQPSLADLTEELKVSGTTIRRWWERETFQDRLHKPHCLATTLASDASVCGDGVAQTPIVACYS